MDSKRWWCLLSKNHSILNLREFFHSKKYGFFTQHAAVAIMRHSATMGWLIPLTLFHDCASQCGSFGKIMRNATQLTPKISSWCLWTLDRLPMYVIAIGFTLCHRDINAPFKTIPRPAVLRNFITWTRFPSLLAHSYDNPPVTTGGFPSQRTSNVELWCFRCFYYQGQACEQTVECRWFETQWRSSDVTITKHIGTLGWVLPTAYKYLVRYTLLFLPPAGGVGSFVLIGTHIKAFNVYVYLLLMS